MKILKVVLGLVALLLMIILVFPLLYPLNLYIPQIQQILAKKLQQPVELSGVSVRYVPMPELVLENVRVGADQSAEIKRVLVQPDFLSWMTGNRVIKRMTIEDARVTPIFLQNANEMLLAAAKDRHYQLNKIAATGVSVTLSHGVAGPLNADIRLNQFGEFEQLLVTMQENPVTLTIEPFEGKYRYGLEAQGWSIPHLEGIRFSSLTVNGVGNSEGIDINDIRGVLYSGTMTGTGRLFFDGQWRLLAKARFNNLQAEALTAGLSPATNISGSFSAEASMVASGRNLDDLPTKPQLMAKIKVHDGSVNNFDLITAIRYNNPGGNGLRGGKTRFDDLSLVFEAKDRRYRFSDINLRSGLLNAGGDMTVNAEGNWLGSVHVNMKSAVNPMSAPLYVSGPLGSPLLSPRALTKPQPAMEESPAEQIEVKSE